METRRISAEIRLFVDAPLGPGVEIALDHAQTHYLGGVMRRKAGDAVALFNGRDGEWRARIVEIGKRGAGLVCAARTRPQTAPPDLWLAFAPVKKTQTDSIVAKACETGCRRLIPVVTRHTNSGRMNPARLRAVAVEAAEQCGRLCVPEVAQPQPLGRFLDGLAGRRVLFCDESGAGRPAAAALRAAALGPRPDPWVVLIGPEGGFDAAEAADLRARKDVWPVGLGPRILRTDTAAAVALALWQSALGDWR